MSSFEESVVRAAGKAQLQVSNGSAGVDAALIDTIAAVPGVEVASGTVQFSVAVPELGRRIAIFGVLFGADHSYREAQFGGELLELPDSLKFLYELDSIALPEPLLREQGWKIGSRFEVVGPRGPQTLVVRGTLRADGALRIFAGDLGVMDSDAAQNAFGELDRFHWIDVVVRAGADVNAVRQSLEKIVAGRAIVGTPFGRGRRMEAMLSTLRWMLTLSGVVAMLVGVFLIQHTVVTAIRQRAAELTKLRALGATRAALLSYLLIELLAVALLGTALGVVAGVGFAALAAAPFGGAIATMYATLPPPRVTLTAGELASAFALGIGAVGLAAVAPSVRSLRLRALRGVDSAPRSNLRLWLCVLGVGCYAGGFWSATVGGTLGFAGGITAFALFVGLMFLGTALVVPAVLALASTLVVPVLRQTWGVLGDWTWQQIRKRDLHTATTVGALAAGVTFTVGMATLLGSYRDSVEAWVDQTFSADVFLNAGRSVSLLAGPTLDPALERELRDVEGVARVMQWRLLEVEFRERPIVVQGMAEALIDRAHPNLTLDYEAGDVIASDTLAERYDLRVGDELTLPAPLEPLRVTIRAIVPDYALDLGSIKLGWGTFVHHFGPQGANILAIETDAAVGVRDVKRRIEAVTARHHEVTVLTSRELQEIIDALIDRSFALTYWLQLLAVLVTVLAMVNATSAAILDRASDLATWRALGLERRRVVRLLVVEAGLLAVFSDVLGMCAGAFVGFALVRVIAPAVAGFRMELTWPLFDLPSLLLLTVVAATVSARAVARSQTSGGIRTMAVQRRSTETGSRL